MSAEITPPMEALLAHLIDYAGLFPPARLDMPPMVSNYASYLAGDDAWMLGGVIVPAGRLDEFEQAAADFLPTEAEAEPWRLNVLTASAGDDALPGHLEAIAAFNERHAEPEAGLAMVDAIELKGADAAAIDGTLDLLPDEIFPFFEIPVDRDPRGLIATLVGSDAGAKVRTGGVTPDLYPSPGDLARFIHACASAGVPFKATAGLHHPMGGRNEAVGVDEFGFLNVFVTAALAAHERAEGDDLVAVLTERDADAVRADAQGLAWRDHRLSTEELEDARLTVAISFGSCSFDEPREDLRGLGLL